MRLTLKLLWAQLRRHWFRTLLALGALVTSVAMVIVVIGGYDVSAARANMATTQAAKALGRFDLVAVSGTAKDAQAGRTRMGAAAPPPAIGEHTIQWLRTARTSRACGSAAGPRWKCAQRGRCSAPRCIAPASR